MSKEMKVLLIVLLSFAAGLAFLAFVVQYSENQGLLAENDALWLENYLLKTQPQGIQLPFTVLKGFLSLLIR